MKDRYDFSRVVRSTNARIEKGILPGATLCVHIEGNKVFEFTSGFSDVEAKKPLRHDAVFRLASMTKPITAVAVLRQQDAGKLDVHDKITKYFPFFAHRKIGRAENGKIVYAGDAARDITIEDLLTHGSGFGSGEAGDMQFAASQLSADETLEMRMHRYADWYLDFSPGSQQAYSPLAALDIAAAIVEVTSGMPYERFLTEYIFDPLDMRNTGYRLSDEGYARLVTMYSLRDDGKGMTRQDMGREAHDNFPAGYISGSTGMFSTMRDYAHFAQMLCGDGCYLGRRVLSPQAVLALRTPHYPIGFAGMDEYSDWGYAVRVRQSAKENVQELTPGSYGWSGAYSTHFWVDPVRRITGVYMANLNNAGGAGAVTGFEFECDVMRSI